MKPIIKWTLLTAAIAAFALSSGYLAGQRSVMEKPRSEVTFKFDAATGELLRVTNSTPFAVTNIQHLGNAVFQFQMIP